MPSLWKISQHLRGTRKLLLVGFVLGYRILCSYALLVLDEGSATSNLEGDRIKSPVGQLVFFDIQGVAHMRYHWLVHDTGGRTNFRSRVNDVSLLAGIFVMLLWPWILLITIWLKGGIQMSDNMARVVKKHPQRTNFFITLFANIISIIVSILFSTAVVRFSQAWARNNDHVTVFDVSLISAFRNQNWPWGMKDHKYLLIRNRWLPAVLAGACIAAFSLVPSGTTSLITPVSFNQTWPLKGTELDFSSNATVCTDWFRSTRNKGTCDWKVSRPPQNGCLAKHTYLSDFQQWCAIWRLSWVGSTCRFPRIRS